MPHCLIIRRFFVTAFVIAVPHMSQMILQLMDLRLQDVHGRVEMFGQKVFGRPHRYLRRSAAGNGVVSDVQPDRGRQCRDQEENVRAVAPLAPFSGGTSC